MSEDLRHGEMVGEYRIDKKVAEGGMGSVYAARHPLIDKKAAIKVLLREHCLRHDLVQRFVDEARAVNRIGHEHIVDVFAFGELPDGRSYFVMEWLEGESLAARLDRGKLPFSTAITVLEQLSDALAAAHQKGIVHRDLKPANIFLQSGRQDEVFVKLLDFGIAKLGAGEGRTPDGEPITAPTTVMGTPEYISPEQATDSEVSFPADVYALGVIAFELFTGRLPFTARAPIQLLYDHATHAPPRPSEVRRSLPATLDELLLAMLAKKPEERPTLDTLKQRLTELGRAFALAKGSANWSRQGAVRPVLGRSFEDLPALLRLVLSELSAGVAWVPAAGAAPGTGTPIAVRFSITRLSLEVELGATVGAVLGDESQSALVRYDRVHEAQLNAIFAIASSLQSDAARAEPPRLGQWQPPSPPRCKYREIALEEGVSKKSEAVGHAAGPTTAERELLIDSVISHPVDLTPVSLPPAKVAPSPLPAARPGASFGGLGAKVLLLAVAISVAAVVSITALAMAQARTDRDFYVRDLNLRMSRALAAALEERLGRWREALEGVARGGSAEDPALQPFVSVSSCTETGCRSLRGEPLPPAVTLELMSKSPRRRLYLLPQAGVTVASVRTAHKVVAGAVPEARLLEVGALAPDLGVAIVDEDGRVLGATGRHLDQSFAQHEIAKSARGGAGETGAREYAAPDGTEMLGAWARAESATVFVTVPTRVSLEALQVLGRNVAGVAVLVLGLAAVIALVFARTMTRRLRVLAQHAARVARGDFEEPPRVPGRDEVGQLAGAFTVMMRALRDRDQEVLRVQRAMSDEESRAVHRQMSAWLETDLAAKLGSIRELLAAKGGARAGARDGRLFDLAEEAMGSLRYALLFANISTRRVDLAGTVQDSVALARGMASERGVRLSLHAPNALLLPRIEGRESELREAVQRALAWVVGATHAGVEVQVSLTQGGDRLQLSIEVPMIEPRADRSGLEELIPLVEGNGGRLDREPKGNGLRIRIAFPTGGRTA